MEEENKEKTKNQEEKHHCKCGSPTATKPVQVGWGSVPMEKCTNPDCPCKKERKKIGWGK